MGIAEAGGVAALLGFLLTQNVPPRLPWMALLACSVMANFAGVVLAAWASSLAGRRMTVMGPDLGRLERTVFVEKSRAIEVKANVLHSMVLASWRNQSVFAAREVRLGLALAFVIVSGVTLIAALAFIAGVHIVG